jgi:hypothetical protein
MRIYAQTVQSDTQTLGVSQGSGWQVNVPLCVQKLAIPEDFSISEQVSRRATNDYAVLYGFWIGC